MSERRLLPALLLAVSAALVVGCVTATSPDATDSPPTEAAAVLASPGSGVPDFLTLAADAPPLVSTTLSFYAVKGTEAEVFMWYHAKPGETDSSRLLRFRLDRRSLCKRPDGSPLPEGDSLLITLTVVDPPKQIVQFEPSGLRFCAGRQAKLNMWYEEVEHDFDTDGDIDARDLAIERRFRVWGQESATDPWTRLFSILMEGLDEIEVKIPGFTNYVIAY